ncbi:MAG: Cell division protein FtsA [Firmicutes bacterium]|nr:Cell division protein FtsA [Bacillota bacterium]
MRLVTQKDKSQTKATTRSERNRATRRQRNRSAWGIAGVVVGLGVAFAVLGWPWFARFWQEDAPTLISRFAVYAERLNHYSWWLLALGPLAMVPILARTFRRIRHSPPQVPPAASLRFPKEPVPLPRSSPAESAPPVKPTPPVNPAPRRGLFARPVLGIDVGNSQIKIVEVAQGQPPRVLRQSIVPTPRESVENGLIREPAALSAAIFEAISRGGFSTRRAATTLTGQNLMLRKLTLPPMPKRELRAAIDWQIEQVLQLNREDTLTDYSVMPTRPGEPSTVILVAMQREPIINFVDFMQSAGFEIIRVDIEPLAVFRAALLATEARVKQGTHLVCDFGGGTTNLSIFREGVLQTARVVSLGGNQLTRAVMMEHQLDFAAAEAAKIRHGFAPENPYFTSLLPTRDRLFGEIVTTVNFFLAENKGVAIDSVQIVGGNSLLPCLAEQLEQNLRDVLRSEHKDFHVALTNPLTRMAHGVQREGLGWYGASLCVAIGLALGEV